MTICVALNDAIYPNDIVSFHPKANQKSRIISIHLYYFLIIVSYSLANNRKSLTGITPCAVIEISLVYITDVVFVIDISGSLSQENLNYSVDLLYDVTEFLTIGPSDIKISIVTFSNTSVVRHNFNNLSTQSDVLSALQSLKSLTTAGGTKTYLALDESHDLLTQASSGMRSGANKTVVVLTDGRSDNLLLTSASATTLHNDGIEVFSVGVGTEVFYDKTELYAIASDPDSYYQHDMENFIHLCNMVPTLVSKLSE